ncbi:sodium-coupled monocarboxylate transporter 1-like isoform X3 [Acanthochromis polyacanthus]|uniref:sodium-coupled monocarboxylate transporter 1-like isoform X3 n=1 Tax=Acanthochromis polyacanthus TaxID=80966 RepID=UPI002234A927|nr:sodium-coupled monocarboxylate transporter 1-like isoform X3 [Acanthochromis polyacanthus]
MPGEAGSFAVADYLVFGGMLVLSAAIGAYNGWTSRNQSGSGHFLTGSRKLTALPVSTSLITTFMTSVTLLTNPVEVYNYGGIFGLLCFSYTVAIFISSEIFMPFFYRLGFTSIYEYLELRFNRTIRLLGILLFMVNIIVLNGLIIYAPALALNQGMLYSITAVSGIHSSHQFSLLVSACRCWCGSVGWNYFYSRCLYYLLHIGWDEGGGVDLCAPDWSDACRQPVCYNQGCDVTRRNQHCLVRCPGRRKNELLGMMPYLVMDIMKGYPGLPGLYFAGVYSGTLSTVSCTINCLTAVTLVDLIKPYTTLSAKHLSILSKGLSLFYGVLFIGMAGLASLMGGMMEAVVILSGITQGPMFGVFTLGVLCPFVNSKGVVSGLVSGVLASLCACLWALFSPPTPEMTRPLPLTTAGCNFTTSPNWTSTAPPTQPTLFATTVSHNSSDIHQLAEGWPSISYLYFGMVGTLACLIMGMIVSLLTGGWNETVDPKLTFMKEDTLTYQLYKFLKDNITRKRSKHGQKNVTRTEFCLNTISGT